MIPTLLDLVNKEKSYGGLNLAQTQLARFGAAIAAFPVRPDHRFIQRFVQWNDRIKQKAIEFASRNFGHGKAFVGIHLRNGRDWENVCQFLREENVMGKRQLFASGQCTGPEEENGPLTADACDPSMDIILEEVRFHVVRLSASAVFVASDRDHRLAQINAHLAKTVRWPVTVRSAGGANVPMDLALLGMADHFIANCVSTFSAFVVRQRHFGDEQMQRHRSVSFLAFPNAAMELLPGGRKNGKAETKNAGGNDEL
ncbi:hypothetical protein niasHT_003876 [Heterodera trifolii]|uniref:GDP-fucose protein O-fucosyltransferase 1 n=1 Tax=Heterodera trifolii TaxID=157864 RepID=A0ABD2LV10_9BILA